MIEELKQKINQLDAGTFQNLCNSILYEEKHVNSIILGGKPGESKTTRGTPDIYYYLQYEQKYVFVECTTQKTRIFDKIKADIKKCFDIQKTGIPIEQISEVIYFHTSANLTPLQDATIRRIGESLKVQITLIGIDSIAEILFKYPILQKEYLNINIDTQQVLTCDAFIKAYNRNNTSAPLYSDFWFRDE